MDRETMRDRLSGSPIAHLGTVSARGRPHVVPCCFVLDGSTLFTAVDAKPKSTRRLQRIRDLEANPSASLIVDHYEDDWTRLWWVRVDVTGRIMEPGAEHDRALDRLAEKYAQYRQHRPPGPVLALDIDGWRAWP